MKRILYLTVFVAAMCLAEVRAEADYWPKDYAQSFAELPVQEGGRIKPMDTFARFKLISIHGKSRLTLNKKEKIKISAVEWLLDVFMRPEIAQDYPTFQINNAEVLTELGIAP
ncbi:MAG: cytochrome c biogenesis protein, partial [Verrucomicrobiales bacterium]